MFARHQQSGTTRYLYNAVPIISGVLTRVLHGRKKGKLVVRATTESSEGGRGVLDTSKGAVGFNLRKLRTGKGSTLDELARQSELTRGAA